MDSRQGHAGMTKGGTCFVMVIVIVESEIATSPTAPRNDNIGICAGMTKRAGMTK